MRSSVAAFVLLALAVPQRVSAQRTPSPEAASQRRTLILDAENAQRVGNHDLALQRALDASAIEMTPSLRRLIAEEYDALGRVRQALLHAEACVREAESTPTLNHREAILQRCRGLRDSLHARGGWVRLTSAAAVPPDAAVLLNGEALTRDELGGELLVRPGSVVLRVELPTDVAVERRLDVAQGAHAAVSLPLAALRSGAPEAAQTSALPVATEHAGSNVGPIVLGGVAVAGLATALVVQLAVVAPAEEQVATLCGAARDGLFTCVDEARRRQVTAEAAARDTGVAVTYAALGVGAAAALGGLVWHLLAPRTRVVVRSAIRDGGAELRVGGVF